MARSRIPTWFSVILLGAGLLVAGIPGLWVYILATAKKLHPVAREIPSVMNSAPLPKWAAAAEQSREMVRASLAARNLPGLSVAVGIDNAIVWAEGFGFANVENSLPVTPDHRFRIGTASSLLTSVGIGLLVDQGRISLDDEIQAHAPEFPRKQWPMTVRQVMGNVAGLKGEDVDEGVLTSSHCADAAAAVKLFAKNPLEAQPGVRFLESTFGWVLLSAAIESAAGKPVTAFLMDRVVGPAGMTDTVRESGTEPVPGEATSYAPRIFANPVYGQNPIPRFDHSCYAGASGFLATPSDLVRFGMAINRGKLLRPETVQMLETPQRLTSGPSSGTETGFGLGWEVKTMTLAGQPVREAGATGLVWGRRAVSLLTFPELGMAVAVTSNTAFEDAPSLAERIAQAFAQLAKRL